MRYDDFRDVWRQYFERSSWLQILGEPTQTIDLEAFDRLYVEGEIQ